MGRAETSGKLPLQISKGQSMQIVVENQGRINFGGSMNADFKGIVSNATLNGRVLEGWKVRTMPLTSVDAISRLPENNGLQREDTLR